MERVSVEIHQADEDREDDGNEDPVIIRSLAEISDGLDHPREDDAHETNFKLLKDFCGEVSLVNLEIK